MSGDRLKANELAAKDFCNQLRKKCGLRAVGKLKSGAIPKHPKMCPIALTLLDCGVDSAWPWMRPGEGLSLYERDGRRLEYANPQVCTFMRDFDAGLYPHLEIPKATTMKIKKPNQRKLTVVPL